MFRITINRQSKFVTTKKSCLEQNWLNDSQTVSKDDPDHKIINSLLNSISSEVDFLLLEAGKKGKSISFEEIKETVLKLTLVDKREKKKKLFEYFEDQIEYFIAQNRLGYKEVFVSTRNSLKTFTNAKDYAFNEIQLDFLRKYEEFLMGRGCSVNTRSVYFRTFRTLWNNAIKDNVCPEDHYPFRKFEFSKYNNPKTKKRAISKAQVEKIAGIEIKDKDTLVNSRNYFLFSYYCRGLNFTDLASLKWTNIKDGELNYIRAKTGEEFNFPLHPAAQAIINFYRNMPGNSDAGYIFPILYKRHSTPQSIRDRKKKILKRVNKDLKELATSAGIEKNITTYVARHSYATALSQSGMSKEDIGKSLGHESTKTTDIYLDEIGDPVLDELINSSI